MNDMTSFANNTGIIDHKYINLAAFDLLMVATNVSTNKYKVSAENNICRYEFLEFLVRTADDRYMKPGLSDGIADATEQLIEEIILPKCKTTNGEQFRKRECYNVKTNEVLAKN